MRRDNDDEVDRLSEVNAPLLPQRLELEPIAA